MTSRPAPALVPTWLLRCARCHEDVRLRCSRPQPCPPIGAESLGALAGLVLAHTTETGYPMHEHGCRPVIPKACPRCKVLRWTEPPRFRQGQGTSSTAKWRRRQRANAARRVRPSRS